MAQLQEIWRDIEGYKNLYQISNLGNVKSNVRRIGNEQKILKNVLMSNGYNVVTLCKNKNHKIHSIHRLIGLCFIPNPLKKRCINHKNGIKTDNRTENLEWATHSENSIHAVDNNLYVAKKGKDSHLYGTKASAETKHKMSLKKLGKPCDFNAKSFVMLNPEGEKITIFNMQQFCRDNNLSRSSMSRVARGKRKQHKGYTKS